MVHPTYTHIQSQWTQHVTPLGKGLAFPNTFTAVPHAGPSMLLVPHSSGTARHRPGLNSAPNTSCCCLTRAESKLVRVVPTSRGRTKERIQGHEISPCRVDTSHGSKSYVKGFQAGFDSYCYQGCMLACSRQARHSSLPVLSLFGHSCSSSNLAAQGVCCGNHEVCHHQL